MYEISEYFSQNVSQKMSRFKLDDFDFIYLQKIFYHKFSLKVFIHFCPYKLNH